VRAEGQARPQCGMVTTPQERIELTGAASCPAWVLPNPGGDGYYLSRVRGAASKVPAAQLGAHEALGFIDDQAVLTASAAMPWRDLLTVLEPFTHDARPEVVTAAAQAVGHLNHSLVDDPALLQRWVVEHFAARALQV